MPANEVFFKIHDSVKVPEILRKKKAGFPMIMGIINCTADSFYDGSRKTSAEEAVITALQMTEDGADIIDIGGESTRPGSEPVSEHDEAERVIPVIERIKSECKVLVSVDTSKYSVALEAVKAGADIINDISALENSPEIAEISVKYNVPVVLMHKKGIPKNMQDNPYYADCTDEIYKYLGKRIDFALKNGISSENIIIDPGIGFGKRTEDNLDILANLERFRDFGNLLLIGLSRKSFIGNILGRSENDRLPATLAANIYSVWKGADIIRVHDVREAADSMNIIKAVERTRNGMV